ncbi:hypothetical protein AMIS_20470 [Actinoplanes missouriensis 431]|uniref:Uncharacterized protein n=1 Tax=Actinoplanes missouriensis (strain ATCC 14538 / DSM 43046 / CBS 188.64 / JCM 3121 / NBRC 102363 / NCIMB 12654 / NRRL B-3342 / UNCC 431) TaxID=512565 RepID=I0H2N0_ACTM4|nr:hypothetical protein AMIS_20470 [Actinoplanes missouriensis 431]
MTFVLAFAGTVLAALAVIAYDLYATRNPLTGDPR